MAGWGGQSLAGQWQSPPPVCLHPSDSVRPRARCRSGRGSAQLQGCRCEGAFGREQALPLPASAKSSFVYKHVVLLLSDRLQAGDRPLQGLPLS